VISFFVCVYPAASSYTDDRAKKVVKVCSFHLVQGTMERRHVYHKACTILRQYRTTVNDSKFLSAVRLINCAACEIGSW